MRVSKKEVNLAFQRLLVDTKDDFYPDPINYKDLRLLQNEIVEKVKSSLERGFKQFESSNKISFSNQQFFDWDVPKSNYVVRHAICLHPIDRIIYNFILNQLALNIEGTLSKARYSYKIKDITSKYLFGKRPISNWLKFRDDIKVFFEKEDSYKYLMSTDIAGFFEYVHIADFKKQMYNLVGLSNKRFTPIIELLNKFLKSFSPSDHSGIPQNYDPSSYLASAFLDFLDKDMESCELKHFRYVDDIKVACKSKNDAQKAIVETIHSLRRYNLNLSTIKTEIWHRGDKKFRDFIKSFPKILGDVDSAVKEKNKKQIDRLLPQLVKNCKEITRKYPKEFDEKLFRAYIWRIVKCMWFRDIKKVRLDVLGKKCVKLIEDIPSRTDTFTRFLTVLKDKKYIQEGLKDIVKNSIYDWQAMTIWRLLIQSNKIYISELLKIARKCMRNADVQSPARNYALLFLGKHGTYQDRRNILSLYSTTGSFLTKRCVLLAIQEYPERKSLYDKVLSSKKDVIFTSLVEYIKKLRQTEYVFEDKRIGSDKTFIS